MDGNVIVGQSGGPTSVINSSLAGVYKTAIDRGAKKVYGMLHGIKGLLDGQYVDLSEKINSTMDIDLLKRTPSSYLGSCRYKLPEISEDRVCNRYNSFRVFLISYTQVCVPVWAGRNGELYVS
jgi:ATP-dependent phosphofructokinase / diphosphate-dependent phosphofructokinase